MELNSPLVRISKWEPYLSESAAREKGSLISEGYERLGVSDLGLAPSEHGVVEVKLNNGKIDEALFFMKHELLHDGVLKRSYLNHQKVKAPTNLRSERITSMPSYSAF